MSNVEEKLNLLDLLYSSQRIKSSRREILSSPQKIVLLFRQSIIFREDEKTVREVHQFSSEARQHFLRFLEVGCFYREVGATRVYSSPSSLKDDLKHLIFSSLLSIFIIASAIYYSLTLEISQSLIEGLLKILGLSIIIKFSYELVRDFSNFILFQYLRQKNLALLRKVNDEKLNNFI